VDTMERVEEDYQTFSVEKYRASLEKLRQLAPIDIVDDISLHITKIHGRRDAHMANLFVPLSPLEIDFPGEGRIRGRTSAINVGDTGTGKTSVVQSICEAARVGLQLSGMTASRTGITYGCEYDERRGWRIKAGALLKMNRQILIVDEAQDLKSEDLKTMAEGIDTGLTRIDRIQNKVFESATRVIFNCNPRHPQKMWEQRTMDSYRYGCEAIKSVFPQMMIRRIDLVLFSTAWDVDKEKIFFPVVPEGEPLVSPEDLQALIFFAWNLKPEQIVIDTDTAHYIRKVAKYLSNKFGAADDLPIVYPEDFRKTMARLSVAYAILDLSTSEDFSQVIVTPGHVAEVCELLERIYEAENCRLDKYAKSYLQSHGLADLSEIRVKIDSILSSKQEKAWRFASIVCQLLKCQDGEKLRKADLVDELGVEKQKIQQEMRFFTKIHLVQLTQQGYAPTPRMFRLFIKLEQTDPEAYNFEKVRDRLFEALGKKGDEDDF